MVTVPFYMQPILRQEDIQKLIQQLQQAQSKAAGEYTLSKGETDKSGERLRQLKTIMSRDTSELSGSEKAKADLMNFASEGFKKGAQGLMQITQQSFDVLNTIYKELKKSSPLMEAVESLFQLAMQLFFMPLGNKLGELLIPAVIELLDNVVNMWDELGDGGLEDIFMTAIEKGISYLASFFTNIGNILTEQGGIFADIGELFKSLGSFIEKDLYKVVSLILDWAIWNVDHLGTLITLIGSFMALHYALQMGTMAVIAASAATPMSKLAGALAIGAVATTVGGVALSGYIGSQVGFASGGYVPATPGGQLVLVGEGGEGEYIVPKSQAENFGNGMTITNNFYGYTTEELERTVNDVLEDQISRARLRSGF